MGRRERGRGKAPTLRPAVVSSPSAWESLAGRGGRKCGNGWGGGALSGCRKEMWVRNERGGYRVVKCWRWKGDKEINR